MKAFLKKIRYFIAWFFLGLAEFIIPRIPLKFTHAAIYLIFILLYPFSHISPDVRNNLLPNIDIAFGDTISKREKRRIAKRALLNLVKMLPDIIYYFNPKNHHKIINDCNILGINHLEAALKNGNGAIAISAHISNFVIMAMRLTMTGLPFRVLIKDSNNDLLKKKYHYYQDILGIKKIDADKGAGATKDILRALRKNEIVIMVSDERKKHDGIPVPFFGKDALTAPGPAILALRTNAPLIPIFIHSKEDSAFEIEILPPLEPKLTGEKEVDIFTISLAINSVIESHIRKYPGQWAWINPRWKGAGRFGTRHQRPKVKLT